MKLKLFLITIIGNGITICMDQPIEQVSMTVSLQDSPAEDILIKKMLEEIEASSHALNAIERISSYVSKNTKGFGALFTAQDLKFIVNRNVAKIISALNNFTRNIARTEYLLNKANVCDEQIVKSYIQEHHTDYEKCLADDAYKFFTEAHWQDGVDDNDALIGLVNKGSILELSHFSKYSYDFESPPFTTSELEGFFSALIQSPFVDIALLKKFPALIASQFGIEIDRDDAQIKDQLRRIQDKLRHSQRGISKYV